MTYVAPQQAYSNRSKKSYVVLCYSNNVLILKSTLLDILQYKSPHTWEV